MILVLALAGFAFWSGRTSASDQPHPTVSAAVDRQSTVVALNGDRAFGLADYGVYKMTTLYSLRRVGPAREKIDATWEASRAGIVERFGQDGHR